MLVRCALRLVIRILRLDGLARSHPVGIDVLPVLASRPASSLRNRTFRRCRHMGEHSKKAMRQIYFIQPRN